MLSYCRAATAARFTTLICISIPPTTLIHIRDCRLGPSETREEHLWKPPCIRRPQITFILSAMGTVIIGSRTAWRSITGMWRRIVKRWREDSFYNLGFHPLQRIDPGHFRPGIAADGRREPRALALNYLHSS